MKILMVNKFYYIKGGSETYYFALKNLLEKNGHTVIDFSMKDERNFNSLYSDYFVEKVDYNGKMNVVQQVKAAFNIIYSLEAKRNLTRLIQETKPDIAHLHIFQHQLSPSILDVLKKYKIPVVYTAHDLKMLCSNYVMMTGGEICEECKGGKYINCLKKKCVKDSLLKSAVNMTEGYFHKWKKSYDVIDRIITPSAFYREKFIEFGVKEDRVIHLPNCLERECPHVNASEERECYFLYFGRLSREKGIMTLVKAVENTSLKLYIVGTGECREEIEAYIKNRNLHNIKVLGFMSGQALIDIVGNSKAVVLPSEWYENGPYSAIEALQLGRPIIGTELGGIPELIDGNGYVFPHSNVKKLQEVLLGFPKPESEEYTDFCDRSKQIFEEYYLPENHYIKLMKVYHDVIS